MKSELVNVKLDQLLWDAKRVNFDLAIQRNFVWKEENSSLLVHSVLEGLSINLIVAQVIDEITHVLDGKQRLTTLTNYLNNKFALHSSTPNVGDIVVAGLKFDSLPEELQNRFTDYDIAILQYTDITNIQRDEIFRRLNNGIPLTAIEKTRAMAQGEVTAFLNDIANTDFFTKKISISESGKNRYVHHEAILQILAVLLDKPTGVGSKELQALALELKEEGITQELKDTVFNTTNYLAQAYSDNSSFLKKIHLSSIFKVAQKGIANGYEPAIFGQCTKNFFKDTRAGTVYANACGSGSARYENVVKRLREMDKYFDTNIVNTVLIPEETPVATKEKTKKTKVVDVAKLEAKQEKQEEKELKKDLVRKGNKTVKNPSKKVDLKSTVEEDFIAQE